MLLSLLTICLSACLAGLRVEAWPFSCYPMFSSPFVPQELRVCRIALECGDGKLLWWRPHFYKLPLLLGERFAWCMGRPPAVRARWLRPLVQETIHCIQNDPGVISARKVCITLRVVTRAQHGKWRIANQVIASFCISSGQVRT